MLFCAMYFNYGPFGAVNDSFSDTSTGQIAYGGAGAKTYLITMACDGNPTILRGQSELVTFGDRVKAGETIELTVPDSSGADTRIYIQGVDWMEDIGDLSDLQVSADNPQLSVASKRLQTLKIGDEDASKVTTNVETLNFGSCPSMMIVDARNAKSLTGTIDLSKMPRLMEAYFGGTGVKAVNVPNGSKIAVLELGEETTQISLMNLKFMDLEGFKYTSLPKLEFLRIENCSQLNPFTMLKSIYNTEGNVIRDIRIIGFDVDGDASDVTMIANLANDVDKDGNPHIYNGIDAEGKPIDNSHPVIEGRLSINGNIYEEDYEALKAVFANLAMEFLGFYVSFKDPEVLRVLLANITTDDGVGLTIEDIEKVTTIGTWFKGNIEIESFDEFERFTGVTNLGPSNFTASAAFYDCTSLRTIILPTSVTLINAPSFYGCTSLTSVGGLDNVTSIGLAFANCTSLAQDMVMPALTTMITGRCFANCPIKSFTAPKLSSLPNGYQASGTSWGVFHNCTELREVNIDWQNMSSIGNNAFYNCISLYFDELSLSNLTSLGQNAFFGVKIKKLNLGKINVLPSASSSTQNYGDNYVLGEIILPNTITTIPMYSFYNYNTLSKITYDWSKVITIGTLAFFGCNALYFDYLDLSNLITLGENAFKGVKIKRLNLGKLTSLPAASVSYETYGDRSTLEEVTIPNTITTLNGYSFNNYSNLHTINCDWENVVYLGDGCFQGCSSLVFDGLNLPNLTTLGQNALYGVKVKKLNLGKVSTLPTSSFNTQHFGDKTILEEVVLPERLTVIPNYSFYQYSVLSSINLDNIVEVGSYALEGVAVPKMIFSNGFTKIGLRGASKNTALTLVDFPSTTTSIGDTSFAYCSALTTVICRATTPPSLVKNAFGAGLATAAQTPIALGTGTIYVPDEAVDAYKAETNWSAYANRIYPISVYEAGGIENVIVFADPAVEAICLANFDTDGNGIMTKTEVAEVTGIANAFYKNTEVEYFNEFEHFTGVTYLVNSNASASIKHCFYGCTNLKEITLPSSLTTINNGSESGQSGAFFGCTSLTNVGGMENLVTIGRYAFRGCTSLAQDIDLPNAEGTIGVMAFYNTAIKRIVNLGKVEVLGSTTGSINSPSGCFAYCENLEIAHLPATLKEIQKGAFGFCTALTTLIIDAATPPTLVEYAWYGSNALANIYVPDGSVDAYKAASGWSDASVVNLIKPMSQYNG